MKFKVIAMSMVVCLSSVCTAQEKQTSQGTAGSIAKSKPKEPAVIPLNNIVEVVEIVVDAYNQRPEVAGDKPTLPKLGTAEFHFKTVADTKGGPSINLWIFKAGYSHEKQVTNDVAFVYIPKKEFKPSGHLAAPINPLDFKDQLTKAITSAANAVKGGTGPDAPVPLQLQQLAVTIGFTVTDEYQGGLNIPIHLVTLGGSITRDTSAIQTVTLTFAFPK